MNRQSATPAPFLVFTDLDGTLLDHDSYDYVPALPALARLAALQVPLIPTTSKTLAEVSVLQTELNSPHPCIVENGGALCVPHGYFSHLNGNPPGMPAVSSYQVLYLSPSYSRVLNILQSLRALHHWNFSGFSDMSVSTVVSHTGLSHIAAARARQRLCSEPLLWQDSEKALHEFRDHLQKHRLTLTRGGRFWHVMGDTSKGKALQLLRDHYQRAGHPPLATIACGDSANDTTMLEAADIAVVVRRPNGEHLDVAGKRRTLVTDSPGPAGWNGALLQLLDDLASDSRFSTEA